REVEYPPLRETALPHSKRLGHTVIFLPISRYLRPSQRSSALIQPSMVSISPESESMKTHLPGSTKFDIALYLRRRPGPLGQARPINFGQISFWAIFRSTLKTSLT